METNDSSDDNRERSATPPRKVVKVGGWTAKKKGNTKNVHRQQSFREVWLKDPMFRDWLLPDSNDTCRAKCKFCPLSSMVAELSNLKAHAATTKHKNIIPGSSSGPQRQLTSLGFQVGKKPENVDKKRAEIKFSAFFAEHNIPFSVADHFSDLLKECITDSSIVKEIELKRTKITAITKNVIGKAQKASITEKLKKQFFSLLTDETTDISTIKTACIVVRYFDEDAQRICSVFWELHNLFIQNQTDVIQSANAETLYTALIQSFTSRDVPLKNMIGFASDGCNVMMGDNNSVKTRLQRDLPGITIVKCVCHSAHLCASEACKKLPESIEQVARDIYNFFKHSDKRLFSLRAFQDFVNVEPHKILKPSQTRWLSLSAVVSRILEQWDALRLFFIDFTTKANREKTDVMNRAVSILEKLCDPFYRMYFYFLDWALVLFTRFNLEFQRENVVVTKLHDKICELYKEILLRYLSHGYVTGRELIQVNPENDQFQLTDNQMYLGVKVYEMLNKPEIIAKPAQIASFKSNCRSFLKTAALEIRKRYDMEDPVLSKLKVFEPKSALSINFRDRFPTLMPVMAVVPRIVSPSDNISIQEIDDQWRRLPLATARHPEGICDVNEPDKFWALLTKTEFHELAIFALAVLSVPHANADCERVFSKTNLIKTKLRNRLITETVNGTLLAAECAKGPDRKGSCVKFEPTHFMLSGMNAENLYGKKKTATQEDSDTDDAQDDVIFDDSVHQL